MLDIMTENNMTRLNVKEHTHGVEDRLLEYVIIWRLMNNKNNLI